MPKTKNRSFNSYIILIALSLFHLVLIYLFKYAYNDLTLFELDVFKTGNFLNLLIPLLTVIGIALLYMKESEGRGMTLFLITLQLISILLVLAADMVAFFDVIKTEFYLLGYPLGKVLLGAALSASIFINIYVLITIWILILDHSYYSLLKSLLVSFLLVSLSIGASLYLIFSYKDKVNLRDNQSKYDMAVVLGAAVYSDNQPSPIFLQRIEKAREILKDGMVNKILLTGSNAPGEMSESESAYNHLMNWGVDKKDIYLEKESTTTSEQIRYLKNNIERLSKNNRVLIVSDDFHLKRVMEMCDFFDVNAQGVSSGYQLNWEKLLYYRVRDSIGLLLFWMFAI